MGRVLRGTMVMARVLREVDGGGRNEEIEYGLVEMSFVL